MIVIKGGMERGKMRRKRRGKNGSALEMVFYWTEPLRDYLSGYLSVICSVCELKDL